MFSDNKVTIILELETLIIVNCVQFLFHLFKFEQINLFLQLRNLLITQLCATFNFAINKFQEKDKYMSPLSLWETELVLNQLIIQCRYFFQSRRRIYFKHFGNLHLQFIKLTDLPYHKSNCLQIGLKLLLRGNNSCWVLIDNFIHLTKFVDLLC